MVSHFLPLYSRLGATGDDTICLIPMVRSSIFGLGCPRLRFFGSGRLRFRVRSSSFLVADDFFLFDTKVESNNF